MLLTDDLAARDEGNRLGIMVSGSVGCSVLAVECGRGLLKNVRDQSAGLRDHAEPRAPPRLDRGPRRPHPPCWVVWRRLVTDVATPECSTHDRHESQRLPGCPPVGVWPRVLRPGEDAPESPH
jgi:hypothetical protein